MLDNVRYTNTEYDKYINIIYSTTYWYYNFKGPQMLCFLVSNLI